MARPDDRSTAHSDVSVDTAFAPRLAWHVTDLLRLAWPVMLSRAGILVMAFVDIAMLGRYAPGAVGIANLGLAVFIPLLVMSIGLCTGLVAVVARAYGAGDLREAGHAWCRALVWGSVISLFAAWGVGQAEAVLLVFGQDAALAAEGGRVADALAPGLWAQVIFALSAFYLEGTRRPHFALGVMVGANVINFALNWVLIWGHLGMPELGPEGAAWASTAARFAAAGAMVAYILYQPQAHARGVRGPWDSFWGPGGWRSGALMRKLGLSAGIGNGFETVGFAAMTFFAGQISLAALDAYSISHNLVSVLFMVGLGLAVATGVRVGNEIGRGRPAEAAFAGWSGFATTVLVMGALGVVVFAFRPELAAIYTDDAEIAARAAALFAFSALVFVPDACQVVLGQAVRALGDAWVAIWVYALSFLVILVPLGWAMIHVVGFQEEGLVQAIVVSCLLATLLLALRFHVLTRGWRRA